MSKRQITITISVEDLQQHFECSEQEANRIWDAIDDECDIEETLNEAVMGDFNILMYDYQRRN
jgi:endonuclease/exonuclease/phosphatase family metal-dependent hydrolase